MYGFGFAPFLIMLWSANCGLQFVLALDDKCPWYIFIISALIDLFYSILVTIGICKRLKSSYKPSTPQRQQRPPKRSLKEESE